MYEAVIKLLMLFVILIIIMIGSQMLWAGNIEGNTNKAKEKEVYSFSDQQIKGLVKLYGPL